MRPIGSGGQAKCLDKFDIKKIENVLRGTLHEKRDLAIIFMGIGGGFRISEIVSLKIGDVIDGDGSVLDQIVLERHSTKSKRSRTVFISNIAQKYLKQHLDELKNKSPEEPVFFGQKKPRETMNPNVAVQLIKNIFNRACISNGSSHSLRRTHANCLRKNGTDLYLIKEQLGHTSLSNTQRYFSYTEVEMKLAVNNIKF